MEDTNWETCAQVERYNLRRFQKLALCGCERYSTDVEYGPMKGCFQHNNKLFYMNGKFHAHLSNYQLSMDLVILTQLPVIFVLLCYWKWAERPRVWLQTEEGGSLFVTPSRSGLIPTSVQLDYHRGFVFRFWAAVGWNRALTSIQCHGTSRSS
jgi:hypothetical protein